MMTESQDAYMLSADDVAALRAADSVSFHYYDGRGYMRVSLRSSGGEPRIYSAREQRLFPATESISVDRTREISVTTKMFGYSADSGIGWRLDTTPKASAFEMIHSAQYDKCWPTVVHLMRAGDVLTLHWIADNNTETIERAALHVDKLDIEISRGEKTRMRFHVETSVSPDNSARMVKRHGA